MGNRLPGTVQRTIRFRHPRRSGQDALSVPGQAGSAARLPRPGGKHLLLRLGSEGAERLRTRAPRALHGGAAPDLHTVDERFSPDAFLGRVRVAARARDGRLPARNRDEEVLVPADRQERSALPRGVRRRAEGAHRTVRPASPPRGRPRGGLSERRAGFLPDGRIHPPLHLHAAEDVLSRVRGPAIRRIGVPGRNGAASRDRAFLHPGRDGRDRRPFPRGDPGGGAAPSTDRSRPHAPSVPARSIRGVQGRHYRRRRR